jgi:hypothetical protein
MFSKIILGIGMALAVAALIYQIYIMMGQAV